ncbi:hypothetical protein [Methanosphaerula palustris]|nr:hypothetical protein [Methanosphaerula palustris]
MGSTAEIEGGCTSTRSVVWIMHSTFSTKIPESGLAILRYQA